MQGIGGRRLGQMVPIVTGGGRISRGSDRVPPDRGCDLRRFDTRFSSCLRCPLEQCVEDMEQGDRIALGREVSRLASNRPLSRRSLQRRAQRRQQSAA